ncbi:putative maltokinase [Nitrospira sp. Nam80]
MKDHWERIFERDAVGALEARLPSALVAARWFGGKARTITSTRIKETIPIRMEGGKMVLVLIDVSYADDARETYVMLLSASFDERAETVARRYPDAVLTDLNVVEQTGERRGILHDALSDPACARSLLLTIQEGTRFETEGGSLIASTVGGFSRSISEAASEEPSVMKGEQSNTSVKFGARAILKLYRRFEEGINPDLDVGRVLTMRGFAHSPALLGSLEYSRPAHEASTVALVQAFIENQGDAWQYTLRELERDLDSVPETRASSGEPAKKAGSQAYMDLAETLGRRTADLHLVLGQETDDPDFAPAPCTPGYWRALRARMERSIESSLILLRRRLSDLGSVERRQAALVFELERQLLSRVGVLTDRHLDARRIRCHGDYHLGQVLYTGVDFVIIDFEGEPARPLAERRAKHVPIVDVAGMIRSFDYAAYAALQRQGERHHKHGQRTELELWARRWSQSAADAFLSGYAAVAADAPFWPPAADERAMLLEAHLIEKACYELSYELNNRPSWSGIPLQGLLRLCDVGNEASSLRGSSWEG